MSEEEFKVRAQEILEKFPSGHPFHQNLIGITRWMGVPLYEGNLDLAMTEMTSILSRLDKLKEDLVKSKELLFWTMSLHHEHPDACEKINEWIDDLGDLERFARELWVHVLTGGEGDGD